MRKRWTGVFAMILAFWAEGAQADENGASLYLLGSGGTNAAILPPLKGVYFNDTAYIYDGNIGGTKDFNLGGNLVANVDATMVANFVTVLWVPSTNVLGGTLAVGGALPYGAPIVDANILLTGPQGRQFGARIQDSEIVVGDPIATASLGWKMDKVHVAVSGMLNIPVGTYREDQIANLSFHRWAGDISAAVSWHDEEAGWDVSGKTGVTFNGRNDYTDYNSGNDLHFELGVEKTLSKQFSLGVQGYHFQQISGDSGSGARLGAFKGRVTAAGGTIAYNTILGRSPTTFRLNILQEFNAKNRMEGTVFMLSLSVPLHMQMPTGAGG